MIKYILCVSIIIISSLLSSLNITDAKGGAINSIIDLEFGIEKIGYQLAKFEERDFQEDIIQKKYNQLSKINNMIIDEFYKQYTAGSIDYYSTHGIITNQRLFAHSSTKMLEYAELKIREETSVYDKKILEHYGEMRITYNRITAIYDKARRK